MTKQELEKKIREKELELCREIHNDWTLLRDYREFIIPEVIKSILERQTNSADLYWDAVSTNDIKNIAKDLYWIDL